jgi:hypothetical protein
MDNMETEDTPLLPPAAPPAAAADTTETQEEDQASSTKTTETDGVAIMLQATAEMAEQEEFEEEDDVDGADEYEEVDDFDGADEYEEVDDFDGTDEYEEGYEEEIEEDDEFDPPYVYSEAYPEAKLVYFKLNNPSSEDEEKVDALYAMMLQDDAFKMKLHKNDVLKQVYIRIYTCKINSKGLKAEGFTNELEEIENGLLHRVLFTVWQRRLVTELKKEGVLDNSTMAWEEATFALDQVSKILWNWNTERISFLLTKAVLAELNCGMEDDKFDSGFRRLLTEQLNNKQQST